MCACRMWRMTSALTSNTVGSLERAMSRHQLQLLLVSHRRNSKNTVGHPTRNKWPVGQPPARCFLGNDNLDPASPFSPSNCFIPSSPKSPTMTRHAPASQSASRRARKTDHRTWIFLQLDSRHGHLIFICRPFPCSSTLFSDLLKFQSHRTAIQAAARETIGTGQRIMAFCGRQSGPGRSM